MNNIKKFITGATSLAMAGLVTVSIFKIGVANIFGKIAVLSLITTVPEGAYGMLEGVLELSKTETERHIGIRCHQRMYCHAAFDGGQN